MTESLEARDDAATRTATSDGGSVPSVVPAAAASIGRFAVLGPVGAGGMGQVFSAYDPQLDRRVALKLLHGHGDPVERARLVREAQALARLAHPNVVVVHEVGAHAGHVFVAMEFVEGTTLREWMDAHPAADASTDRRVRALEILLDAGRGIMAAHAAGLVHRDVKPRNILVGNDGRVRVVDFGLARSGVGDPDELAATARPDAPDPLDVSLDDRSGSGTLLAAPLTQTGKVVGTPAYMAPEQFRRGPVDPAADQFAFCVTAWEVLFGARPFGGTTMAMLMAIREGEIERPAGIDVPATLEAALRRGLSHRPSRRHPDMATLLGVFEEELVAAKGETRRRRGSTRGWWIAGGVGVVAAVGAFWLGGRDVVRCDGAAERFAGVWDAPRKAEIRDAVLGTGAVFADGTWTRLEANVDGWRAAWEAGHRDACEASRVRGEQSERLMDLRMACLDSRRQRLSAYLDLLASPSVAVLAGAEEGFATLPAIDRCADVEYVQRRGQRSEDPEIAKLEDEVLAEVARASSLQAAGDFEGALAIADAAVVRAGGSELARAHALLAKGRALDALYRPDDALGATSEAYRLARLLEIDEVAVAASRLAAGLAGVALHRLDEGRWWADVARLEATRSHDDDAIAAAMLVEARILENRGQLDEARTTIEAMLPEIGSESRLESEAFMALGSIEAALGHIDRGLELLERSRSAQEARLGSEHPALATNHLAEATAHLRHADMDAALASSSRAVEIAERAYGKGHIATFRCLDIMANVVWERGDADATLDLMRRARAINRPTPLPPAAAARIIAREAETLMGMGRLAESVAAYREALALSIAELGTWHAETAVRRAELAAALAANGEGEEALRLIDAALASDTAELGGQSEHMIRLHHFAAVVLERAGLLERAIEQMRQAMTHASTSSRVPSLFGVKLHMSFCGIARRLDDRAEAIAACERALELGAALPGLATPVRVSLHNTAGAAYADQGNIVEARKHYVEGLRLHAEAGSPEDMLAAVVLANIAELDLLSGDLESAAEGYARSISIRERLRGPASPELVVPLRGLADARLRMRERGAAIEAARRALDIADATIIDPLELGHTHFVLARALWMDPTRRRDASAAAVRAKAHFVDAGTRAAALSADLDAWQRSHAPG